MDVSVDHPEEFDRDMFDDRNPVQASIPSVATYLGADASQTEYINPVKTIGDLSTLMANEGGKSSQNSASQQRDRGRDVKRSARELPSRKKSPEQPYRHVRQSAKVEKKKSKKWKSKTADSSKLSSELNRLLVGDDTTAGTSLGESPTAYKVQHPLRAALHNLPGFAFDDELDSIIFGKHRRVSFGLAELMEEGGRDAIKVWLEEFLLLAFQTMETIVARYPRYNDLDEVPMGFVFLVREMESATEKSPAYPTFSRARRVMERRIRQSYDLRRLIDWVLDARRRFLESKPKPMPGFGVFGQMVLEEGTELEKQLWAVVDAKTSGTARYTLF
ncbi:hypothetical protein CORC01_02981 [Colletotrichum orchidophilum]|uniref:Uncharacterized protein n=1 Tax=Colletotrichum orchidophilum TaxID=1209926 RepID=A0A1G4BJX9_9PEZI|nr:uncharacterized protein CORC01_02981 [Colletotrichum orchidophilum]OHF01790.1 hypothetical protein CORC01_02981 [Colletotrichum orchidophilum]